MKRNLRNTFRLWVAFLALMVFTASAPVQAQVQEANAGRGGEPLDLNSLAVPGRVTLVDFYSPYCHPCVSLAPLLEELAAKRSDLAVKKVNINRPGARGIDWRSPLVQQHGIRSVPYFMIFDDKGKVMAHGKAATRQLKAWLRETGLLTGGERGKR
ncbi:MAG: thioredoxin family protein [Deltaproteobacteria bacterium]|nr:thioredoxin family protein [Deltaproteobacteria bacterium]